MFTVITGQLVKDPVVYTKDQAIYAISKDLMNVFASSDYHMLKETNKLHNRDQFNNYQDKTNTIIQNHNQTVGKDDVFLCLGDISEAELKLPAHISKLFELASSLTGMKFLIVGNNDNLDDEFYYKCGFRHVFREPFTIGNYVFSHEPLNMPNLGYNSDYINIHGHIHMSKIYRNMDWKNHIDVCWNTEVHDFRPQKISKYIDLYKSGAYNGKTVYAPFLTDDNQV